VTLRVKLYALTLVLSAMALAFVVVRAKESVDLRAAVAQAQAINAIADRYLAAAADWAVERGTANTVIANPAAATPAQRQTIAQRRQAGDAAFAEAGRLLAAASFLPVGARQLHDRTAERLRNLAPLRARVDAASVPEPELTRDWFPAISALVLASMDVRMEIERQLDPKAPQALRTLFEVKGLLATMSEFAGRERGGGGPASSSSVGRSAWRRRWARAKIAARSRLPSRSSTRWRAVWTRTSHARSARRALPISTISASCARA
jgi:hypothetical protein